MESIRRSMVIRMFHDTYNEYDEYFRVHDIKDNNMSIRDLKRSYDTYKNRARHIREYQKELEKYNKELHDNLIHIYFNPESNMVAYSRLRLNIPAAEERKLLLSHYQIFTNSVKACYPENDTHQTEFMHFILHMKKQ